MKERMVALALAAFTVVPVSALALPRDVAGAPPAASVLYPLSHNIKNPPLTVTNSGNCNPEEINFIPFEQTLYYGDSGTLYVDACLNEDAGLEVRLVEEDTLADDTLEEVENISMVLQSIRIIFRLECAQGGKLVGHSGNSQDSGTHTLAVETDYAGLGFEIGNSYDNVGPDTGAGIVRCLAPPPTPTPCPPGGGGSEQGQVAGFCPPGGVGGIAELPEVAGAPLATGDRSGPSAGVLVGTIGAAVAVAIVTLGAGAWYARRRWRS